MLTTCSFALTWFGTALLKTTEVLFNAIQDERERTQK